MPRRSKVFLLAAMLALAACTDTPAAPDAAAEDAATLADAEGNDAPGEDVAPSDSGGTDIGNIDAPIAADANDGGPDAGPSTGCDGRDYLLCEDFESGAVGELPAGWVVGGGWQEGESEPMVSDAEARSGSHSLASSIAINGQRRAEHSLDALGDARGTHWGRVFYRVKTPVFLPMGGSVVHNTLVALLSSTGESRVVDTVAGAFGPSPDGHQFLYNLPDDSCCSGSGYDYRSYDDEWHCAEWRVDASTQSYEFYYDGDEVTEIRFSYGAGDTRARMEAFSGIALGWRNYQTPDIPYETYFDDLALDDERIGCD